MEATLEAEVTVPLQRSGLQAQVPMPATVLNENHKIDITRFNDAQRQRLNQIISSTGTFSCATVDGFGVEVQKKASQHLDRLLEGLKTYETGKAGEITLELARHIKHLNLPAMRTEAESGGKLYALASSVPLVGKYLSALYRFKIGHDDVLKFVTEIEEKAQREFGKLAATNLKLDQLAQSSLEQLSDLEIHLAAGQVLLLRRKAEFSERREDALKSNDLVAMAKLRDEVEQINAFETRLLKMHIAFTDALVSIPQIRATQEAGRIEGNNIMDTILFDLPRLKSAIIRVASLQRINAASKADQARREITRQIGQLGADALDEAYTRAKESQGSGVEDVAVLAATADKLLETIAKGIRIDEENREKRRQAGIQLEQVRGKLIDGLQENARAVAEAYQA